MCCGLGTWPRTAHLFKGLEMCQGNHHFVKSEDLSPKIRCPRLLIDDFTLSGVPRLAESRERERSLPELSKRRIIFEVIFSHHRLAIIDKYGFKKIHGTRSGVRGRCWVRVWNRQVSLTTIYSFFITVVPSASPGNLHAFLSLNSFVTKAD